MKKILFVILLLLGFLIPAGQPSTSAQQSMVYVVMSDNAVAYHCTMDCRAVRNATHPVREVPLAKAREMGRRPCGICYRTSQ